MDVRSVRSQKKRRFRMENESREDERKASLISSFCEITPSSRAEAEFFLESHGWDLDAAVSTFLDDDVVENPNPSVRTNEGTGGVGGVLDSPSQSPEYAQSDSSPSEPTPTRSRSPTPPASRDPYQLRARRTAEKQTDKPSGSRQTGGGGGSNIRSLADLNRSPAGGEESDSDEGQEYYAGGQKSGMLVQDPRKAKDVDAIFDQARHSAVDRPAEPSRPSARSFTGTGRLLSGETVPPPSQQPQPPQDVSHTITFWRNGFTVDDGPLRRLDDPANASFLESISKSECPDELEPTDRRVRVHVDLIRREENFTEKEPPRPRQRAAFLGVGRTLGSTSTPAAASDAPPPLTTSPSPSMGLVVDQSLPTTSIQLRLADGTRLVSRFNHHHTVRDICGFIDASRPGGRKDYQLLTMGFPPKQLADLDQTIEQAGISNSVVIQKF